MAGTITFRRAAVIGTGLIGGSFALALRKHFPEVTVVGYSHAGSLERALHPLVLSEGGEGRNVFAPAGAKFFTSSAIASSPAYAYARRRVCGTHRSPSRKSAKLNSARARADADIGKVRSTRRCRIAGIN